MAEDDTLMSGHHTVILARDAVLDADADDRLLRATERALELPRGSLVRPEGMSRAEFRLVEGVSVDVAEQLAAIASRLGYAPRLRARVGLKWSSERGVLGLIGFTSGLLVVFTLFTFAFVVLGVAIFGSPFGAFMALLGLPLFTLAWFAGHRLWLRGLYMPLVVPRSALQHGGCTVGEDSPVSEAARDAKRALDRLHAAVSGGEVPVAARDDLQASHRQLHERVVRLEVQAASLTTSGPSSAASALRGRLDRLAEQGELDVNERKQLEAALASEARVVEMHESRRATLVAELLLIRRAADEAVANLQNEDAELDPTSRLRQQVSGLRAASDEGRREVAQRARRANALRQS